MEETLIKEFAELKSKDKVQEFYETTLSILTSALDDLQNEYKITSLEYENTKIFPMGDYTNDTFIDQTGELEIVIATSNPQIKIANTTYVKSLKDAKTKKQKEAVISSGTFDEIILNLINCLSQYFDETSVLLVVNEGIKILCLEEYGFKILIRFATFSEDDKDAVLSFWNPLQKNIKQVNLFLYNENMSNKDKETNGNYKKLVRILKNIRKTILVNKWTHSSNLNKYFIELIAYNIPSSIMQNNDIEIVYKKAINYLENCNVLNFKSFDNISKVEDFDLAKVSFTKIKNFLGYLSRISF